MNICICVYIYIYMYIYIYIYTYTYTYTHTYGERARCWASCGRSSGRRGSVASAPCSAGDPYCYFLLVVVVVLLLRLL